LKEPAVTFLLNGAALRSLRGRFSARVASTPPDLTAGGALIPYQDDFETPGISPFSARPRKHRRHNPNLRIYARDRPQILQRFFWRVENFGFLFDLAMLDVLAIFFL
jgi:hypothetical protein